MKYFKCFIFGLLFLLSCNSDLESTQNPYQFIPQNTQVIVKINEGSLFKQTWNNSNSIQSLSPKEKETRVLISLIEDNTEVGSILCFSPTGKEKFSPILIQNKVKDSLKSDSKYVNYSGVNIKKITVDGINLFEVQIGLNRVTSSSGLIIENIIRNFQTNQSGINNKEFYKLFNNLENNSAFNLLINKNSNYFLNKFLPKTSIFPNFNENWIAFDGNFNSPLLDLDGITISKDSIPSRLGIFKNQSPNKIKSDKIIPKSFNSFLSFPIENIPQLTDQIKTYAKYHNTALDAKSLKDFSSIDEFSIMKHDDGDALILHRSTLNHSIISLNNFESSYRNIRYQSINDSLLDLNTILSLFKIEFKANFIAEIQDFYVLTNQESLIKLIISSVKDRTTIENSNNFISLMESLSDLHSGIWVSKTSSFNIKKTPPSFKSKKFPLTAMQWVKDEEISHLHFRFGDEVPDNKKNTVVNETNISSESEITLNPKWVKNHRSNGHDIVFQDDKNVLYLYSSSGNLFWKKKLKEQIIGDIIQVDLYKNKKLQMAFRTKNHFMILDRNGKIVEPFNKTIKSNSNNIPLSVFDYDNNRNYRFLLVQDKDIIMLDSKGKKVNGFKFSKTKKSIINPVKHIRIKGKDFIIVQEENGNINILNRRGESVIDVDSKLFSSINPIWSYLDTFTTSDVDGNLVQIDTKGNIIKTPDNFGDNHLLEMTTKTLVSISENTITIKGIPVKLPYGNYTRPKIFYINNTLYIATTDLDSQKVYLFLSNGNQVQGFPVYGTSFIDIANADNDKSLEMIVQSESDGVIIYQIN